MYLILRLIFQVCHCPCAPISFTVSILDSALRKFEIRSWEYVTVRYAHALVLQWFVGNFCWTTKMLTQRRGRRYTIYLNHISTGHISLRSQNLINDELNLWAFGLRIVCPATQPPNSQNLPDCVQCIAKRMWKEWAWQAKIGRIWVIGAFSDRHWMSLCFAVDFLGSGYSSAMEQYSLYTWWRLYWKLYQYIIIKKKLSDDQPPRNVLRPCRCKPPSGFRPGDAAVSQLT
jgi:hypothetical protein